MLHPPSPPILPPPLLANLHPSNTLHINGRVLSRSPTGPSGPTDDRNLSPNKLHATRKPVMGALGRTNGQAMHVQGNSPKYGVANYSSNGNPRQPLINSNGYDSTGSSRQNAPSAPSQNRKGRARACQNHTGKPAEFYIQGNDSQPGYCQKCAISLASKGFSIARKQPQDPRPQLHKPIIAQHRLQPFDQPQYASYHGYSDIHNFIAQIDTIHNQYLQQIGHYQQIQSHYEHQYTITQDFYEQLLTTVEQMREDHLADLEAEARKHTQIAFIKEDHLKIDIEEIEFIRGDIIKQLGMILDNYRDASVQERLGFYKQTLMQLADKVQEEQLEFTQQLIDETEQDLDARLKKIEEFMLNVWNEKAKPAQPHLAHANVQPGQQRTQVYQPYPPPMQDKSPRTVKNIINFGQKPAQRGNACRRLFDEEPQNPMGESDQPAELARQEQEQAGGVPGRGAEEEGELAGQISPQFKKI